MIPYPLSEFFPASTVRTLLPVGVFSDSKTLCTATCLNIVQAVESNTKAQRSTYTPADSLLTSDSSNP